MWIIDITKNPCSSGCGCDNNINYSIPEAAKTRGPKEIKGCCNTCNALVVAAQTMCGCLEIRHPAIQFCKALCFVFVEYLRQGCEWCCEHGGIQEKCWTKFETWKDDFQEQNSSCPKPPERCS